MKTKNFLLTGALLIVALFSVNGVMAEGTTTPSTTGQATVNIKISTMQAIEVIDNVINLEYTSIDQFTDGVSSTKEGHLKVFSTGAFDVTVKANSDFEQEALTIDANTVKILAISSDDSPGVVEGGVALSTDNAQTLISSETGGHSLFYDVKYSHKDKDAFKYDGMFTAEITYLITAK